MMPFTQRNAPATGLSEAHTKQWKAYMRKMCACVSQVINFLRRYNEAHEIEERATYFKCALGSSIMVQTLQIRILKIVFLVISEMLEPVVLNLIVLWAPL